MQRSHPSLLLIAVLALAALLRLWMLPSIPPGLWQDEAMNGNNAVEALANTDFSAEGGPAFGWKVFYPENFGREGLFINIQALFLALVGQNEPWVLRLPSALFGVLTVLGVYFLTKELFKSPSLSLLAAFLLATSFWHINFSRLGFRAIMAPFFLTWGVYALLFVINRSKQYSNILKNVGISVATLVGGVIYGLGFHSYIAYRATPLLFLVFIPRFSRERRFWTLLALFGIGAALSAAPLGIYFLNHPEDFFGRTAQISVFNETGPLGALTLNVLKTLGMFFVVGDLNPRHNIPGWPLLFPLAALLFAAGVVLALQRRTFPHLLLLGWLAVAAAPVVISNEGLPHALRSLLMAPAVFILAALGGIWAWERWVKKLATGSQKVILALFILVMIAQAYYFYFILWAHDPRLASAFNVRDVSAARTINALPPDVPKYVAAPLDDVIRMQTIYFLTDTYLPERRAAKNVFYVNPSELENAPLRSAKIIFE